MSPSRRELFRLAAGAAALLAPSRFAAAQSYPNHAPHLVVGFTPGGGVDVVARMMGQWLSQRLGQQFVIENRPGAGGNIATEEVSRAPADGYTLLMVIATNAINATLYDKLNYDFMRDIAPVASIVRVPNIMEVNLSLPVSSVPEFIAYAKAHPGELSFGSSGNGSMQHVAAALFKTMAGIDMVHVPYRGPSLALNDLLGGQIQVMFDSALGSIEKIRAGKVRALAVTSTTRLALLPDVPTVGEFLPGYEAMSWLGVGAPANTPRDVIFLLNSEINAGVADPTIRSRLLDFGTVPTSMTPDEFRTFIADETERWGKIIKYAGIQPD